VGFIYFVVGVFGFYDVFFRVGVLCIVCVYMCVFVRVSTVWCLCDMIALVELCVYICVCFCMCVCFLHGVSVWSFFVWCVSICGMFVYVWFVCVCFLCCVCVCHFVCNLCVVCFCVNALGLVFVCVFGVFIFCVFVCGMCI